MTFQESGIPELRNNPENFYPKAWFLDAEGHDFGDQVTELILAERDVPVGVGIDRSLRAKVIDACGMTCTFCHNEGTPVAADVRRKEANGDSAVLGGRVSIFSATNGVDFVPAAMKPTETFSDALTTLRTALDVDELHLTGGEPSLHRDLPGLIAAGVEAGFDVKMTSNGENGARHMSNYALAGLKKVNFSIFGTTPEELASVQHEKYADVAAAERKITSLKRSITAALENNIDVAANVVIGNTDHINRVHRILDEYEPQLDLRILNDLDAGPYGNYVVYKTLADLGAKPVAAKVEAGSSNARVDYRLPDGRKVTFKQLRPVKLPETCSDCHFNNDEDCQEGFYGVRLYQGTDGDFRVGVCIQRMDLTMSLGDFVKSGIVGEIRNMRSREYAGLNAQFAGGAKPV